LGVSGRLAPSTALSIAIARVDRSRLRLGRLRLGCTWWFDLPDTLPQIHRTPWQTDLGHESGGRGLDVHVHDSSAHRRM